VEVNLLKINFRKIIDFNKYNLRSYFSILFWVVLIASKAIKSGLEEKKSNNLNLTKKTKDE